MYNVNSVDSMTIYSFYYSHLKTSLSKLLYTFFIHSQRISKVSSFHKFSGKEYIPHKSGYSRIQKNNRISLIFKTL